MKWYYDRLLPFLASFGTDWNAFYVDAENRLAACELEPARERKRSKELEERISALKNH